MYEHLGPETVRRHEDELRERTNILRTFPNIQSHQLATCTGVIKIFQMALEPLTWTLFQWCGPARIVFEETFSKLSESTTKTAVFPPYVPQF